MNTFSAVRRKYLLSLSALALFATFSLTPGAFAVAQPAPSKLIITAIPDDGDADRMRENFGALAIITILFCLLSLSLGFIVPKLFGISRPQRVASAFEIGVHNATLSIVIAQSVLDNFEMSLPAAVYGVLMFFVAAAFGFLIRDRARSA